MARGVCGQARLSQRRRWKEPQPCPRLVGCVGSLGPHEQLLPLDAATLVLQVCCVQGCAMACRCEAIAFM